jgi:alpha-glucosidase (family GH31 glycosyl hydrolase)
VIKIRPLLFLALFSGGLLSLATAGQATSFTVGSVRVQLLSGSLVRLEAQGPAGFEDRRTFHIVNRDWPGTTFSAQTNAGTVEISTENYLVRVPQNAASLNDVSVWSSGGAKLYSYDGKLENSKWLPSPGERPPAWWFADSPRMVPPAWGLTPPPAPMANAGWDLNNEAPDVYVFVPRGDYRQLRQDFLKLTGPTEMPPLFMFGAFDSRWFDYGEATALKQVEDYRSRKIPLDVLVVDTGWRANASTGYRANTYLFPDLPRFFAEAHAKNVKVLFNDHPEPLDTNAPALDASELDFRFNGLSGRLRDGLDIWWYDRNWWVALVPPAPNLCKEVWGMRIYHDTTARVRPEQRPLIMANVDGIDNGLRQRPMNVAAHRFPFQWTGDIGPGWEFLRRGVENAVHAGVQSAFPYLSEDLGGHVANPTTEQYIRWIEYGAFSPVYRPHCTHNLERMPWTFGPPAETIARNLLNLRYRLLPVFYAAAHENYETGEPLLRRLDLDFPQFPEAAREDEFLLGKNILVAPVLQDSWQVLPGEWLKTAGGQTGLRAEFFANENLAGAPAFTRTEAKMDFNWNRTAPAPNFPRTHFSARWSGTVEVPAAAGDVKLAALADDGVRVWLDGREVVDAWGPHDSTTSEASGGLTAGVPHRIRVEYLQLDYDAVLKLQWQPAKTPAARRVAWLPPGDWINAWNGEIISGPATVTNFVPLDHIPLFVRSGTLLPLAPEMQFTGEKPWSPVALDLYPRAGATNTASLYEDDTQTTAYQRGEFRTTQIAVAADDRGKSLRVMIDAAKGNFSGALAERSWTLRIHPTTGWAKNSAPGEVRLDGKKLITPIRRLARAENAMPFGDQSGTPDAEVFEVTLPAAPVFQGRAVEVFFTP